MFLLGHEWGQMSVVDLEGNSSGVDLKNKELPMAILNDSLVVFEEQNFTLHEHNIHDGYLLKSTQLVDPTFNHMDLFTRNSDH